MSKIKELPMLLIGFNVIIKNNKIMFKYYLFILIIAIGTTGQLLLKSGVNSCSAKIGQVNSFPEAIQAVVIFLSTPMIILALTFSVFGALIYLQLLHKFDLSFIFPALAVMYLSVLFFSWLILHEQISALRVIGTLIITVGVLITFLSKQ